MTTDMPSGEPHPAVQDQAAQDQAAQDPSEQGNLAELEPDPAERYAAEQGRLWAAATAALTTAAKLIHPRCGQLDFADFLASSLAAVTANVGGVDELLAGRPGSWEAGLVEQLINGTIGYDPSVTDLIRWRTEPVVVGLNVATLVDEHVLPGRGPYADARDALDAGYHATITEAEEEALDQAVDRLQRGWAERYQAYADRFTAAVHTAAAHLGVTVAVTVEASADPDNAYGDPVNTADLDWDGAPGWADGLTDLLAGRLWRAASDAHPISELTGSDDHHSPATGSGAATRPSQPPPGL